MAIRTYQQSSALTGDFSSAGRNCCFITVPVPHVLVSATGLWDNSVTTGTVEAILKRRIDGDNRGGATVGTILDNSLIDPKNAFLIERDFELSAKDKGKRMPAMTQYFLAHTATNSADRLDNPCLVIKVDDTG